MDGAADFISRFGSELWHILLESGVWLMLGLAMAGAVHAFVPRAWFMRHLGGRGVVPVAKASLLGIPMPLCSCSVIPVAAGVRRQGAGKGATAAFAISTPQTGEESIPLTWALFGPVFAFARPIIAVVTAFVAGMTIDAVEGPEDPKDRPADDAEASVALPAPATERPTFAARAREAGRHGFGVMLRDLAPWLTWGIVVAALVAAAVPEGWIAEHVGTGIWPKLLMLVIGIPVYICATSSTPLAWSLVMAGLSPGAALILLLVGPAVNVATMSWVVKDLGWRVLVVYVGVIAAVALGAGIVFDEFFAHAVTLAERAAGDHHAPGGWWAWTKAAGAIAFVAVLTHALAERFRPAKKSCCAGAPAAAGGSCCAAAAPAEPAACCAGKTVALPTPSCCGGKGDAPACGCSKP